MKSICLALAIVGSNLAWAGTAVAGGDPARGSQIFLQRCAACHSFERNVNKVGPSLLGVIDQPPASLQSFQHYSAGMKAFAAAGNKWDDATLARYLKRPRDLVPETNMSSAGIKSQEDIADLIAFLHYYSRQ